MGGKATVKTFDEMTAQHVWADFDAFRRAQASEQPLPSFGVSPLEDLFDLFHFLNLPSFAILIPLANSIF